jgi:class 3 adenylate cyclase
MNYNRSRFGDTVLHDYSRRREGVLKGSVFAHAVEERSTAALGHPSFDGLAVGERQTVPMVIMFLDLRDFTARSFWDPQDEVVDLAHAVLAGFIETVLAHGGYPLGLRGDGLFAGFGHGIPEVAVTMALMAGAFALDAVREEVNPRLAQRGIAPVQARAGLDFGDITFVRTGTQTDSEINPTGFAANFAAKCEKRAKSWEIVVGERLATVIADAPQLTRLEPPKEYTRNYVTKRYHFYDYNWAGTLRHASDALHELGGRPVSSIAIG